MTPPRRILLSLLLALAPLATARAQQAAPAAAPAAAPIDPAKLKAIRELISVSRVAETMAANILNALPAQRRAHPEVPGAFWDAFAKKATEQIPALVDSLVPIYARHFSQDDLAQLIAFYKTPAGQHSITEQPAIMLESTELGRRWGMQMGQQIGDSLSRAGGE